MSVNKRKKDEPGITTLSGLVVLKKFGAGSKSEHKAICLETDKGDYILRQAGGNPFHDETLQQWVGKEITALGILKDYTFFAKKIKEK